jgi:hypothetical protein
MADRTNNLQHKIDQLLIKSLERKMPADFTCIEQVTPMSFMPFSRHPMLCKVDKVTFHDFSSSLRDFWVNNVNKGQIIMA